MLQSGIVGTRDAPSGRRWSRSAMTWSQFRALLRPAMVRLHDGWRHFSCTHISSEAPALAGRRRPPNTESMPLMMRAANHVKARPSRDGDHASIAEVRLATGAISAMAPPARRFQRDFAPISFLLCFSFVILTPRAVNGFFATARTRARRTGDVLAPFRLLVG